MSEIDDLHRLQDAVYHFVTNSRIEMPGLGRSVPGTCYPNDRLDLVVIYTTRDVVLRMQRTLWPRTAQQVYEMRSHKPEYPPKSILDL